MTSSEVAITLYFLPNCGLSQSERGKISVHVIKCIIHLREGWYTELRLDTVENMIDSVSGEIRSYKEKVSIYTDKCIVHIERFRVCIFMPRNGIQGICDSQIHLFYCPPLLRKCGDIKSHLSICQSIPQSVCHKNFNLSHNFCSITDRALILGMCVLCDKTFFMPPA